tara:strand:+ start:82001 stop:82891 length:891 start_codon:yes stop_codon:yes gene_type:complete
MSEVEKYYYDGKWKELDVSRESLLYPVERNWSYLDVRSPFSIGTNISSAIMGMVDDRDGPLLSDRPLITIEPEYRLPNNWLSIKGSIAIGIPAPPVNRVYSMNDYSGTYNGIVYYDFPNGSFDDMQVNDSYYYYTGGRTRYVPFEGGISLKFWPIERVRERFFVFGGLMVGACDYKAFTLYDTFEEYEDWGSTYFRIVDQEIVVRSNPFTYFRFEGGVGYNFQISKRFTFSSDLTITNKHPNNLGSEPDIVFARLNNDPFEKVYEDNYMLSSYNFSSPLFRNVLFRFKLRYHFQKQ